MMIAEKGSDLIKNTYHMNAETVQLNEIHEEL